jgi:hypothetical protein
MSNQFPSSASDFSEQYIRYPLPRWPTQEDRVETYLGSTGTFTDERFELTSGQSRFDENYINYERLKIIETEFSFELKRLIIEEDFEYGITSKVDIFIKNRLLENALATKTWLNHMFLDQFTNVSIIMGLLRVVSRLNYFDIYPEGQTMAIAALSHRNLEVRECGVRAFENWETLESLKVLENLKGNTPWLQEYIDEVVDGLRRKYGVRVREEN